MKIKQLFSIVSFSKGEKLWLFFSSVPVLIVLLLEKWGEGGGVAKSTEIEQKKAEHFYQGELTDWRMGSL